MGHPPPWDLRLLPASRLQAPSVSLTSQPLCGGVFSPWQACPWEAHSGRPPSGSGRLSPSARQALECRLCQPRQLRTCLLAFELAQARVRHQSLWPRCWDRGRMRVPEAGLYPCGRQRKHADRSPKGDQSKLVTLSLLSTGCSLLSGPGSLRVQAGGRH